MNEFIGTLLQAIVTATIPILAAFAARWMNAMADRAEEGAARERTSRYMAEVTEAVSNAVLHTAQTYVDTLKDSGTWTEENQREALKRAVAQAKALLTVDVHRILTEAHYDVNEYLSALIEAEVKAEKLSVNL